MVSSFLENWVRREFVPFSVSEKLSLVLQEGLGRDSSPPCSVQALCPGERIAQCSKCFKEFSEMRVSIFYFSAATPSTFPQHCAHLHSLNVDYLSGFVFPEEG